MAKIQEYSKPSDIINLSWTSFSLLQPYYLRKNAKTVEENLKEYKSILDKFSKQNETIKGNLKVDGKEVFYDPGKELEKFLEREIIQVVSISNFPQIVYERAIKERKEILNKYIDLTNAEIKKVDYEFQVEHRKTDYDKLKLEELRKKRRKMEDDIDRMNRLLDSDMN